MTRRFDGKIAFVTGGTKGLGRSIALRLAREGCDVAVGFITSRDDAEETVKAIEAEGVRGLALRGNIANPAHLAKMFGKLESELGGLDFFVSNAASGAFADVLDITDKQWQLSIDSIATTLHESAKLAVPMMEKRGGGRIIGMASLGANRVMKHYAAIGVAKAAMESLIRYLAMELFNRGVVVNAVSAGVTDTRSLSMFPNAEEMAENAKAFTPANRLTDPEDVAGVVAFLCSNDANWIVGQTIVVDGGLTLRA